MELEDFLDSFFDGEMSYGFAADGVTFFWQLGEMQVAADMVILIETSK